jgi:hypothetical protein
VKSSCEYGNELAGSIKYNENNLRNSHTTVRKEWMQVMEVSVSEMEKKSR